MEEDFVNNDLVWENKEVSTFKRGLVPRTSFIRSEKGKIVSDSMGIKIDEGNISTDTSTQLRKRRRSQKEISAVRDTSMMGRKKQPRTETEVHEAIWSLKAPGIDELPTEKFKEGRGE
jgi:hypothetical protein